VKTLFSIFFLLSFTISSFTQKNGNPIVPYVGMADPHIFIFNNKPYLYATRDIDSLQTKSKFVMPDWHIWSTDDLINWKHELTIDPKETYMGSSTSCWATDMGYRNGKYYFYFSNGNRTTGVMVADSPTGPFKDALGKPMLDTTLTTSKEYDPSILQDDNNKDYIIFGHHRDDDPKLGYYIAELNNDMISLKTTPKKVIFTGDNTYLSGNDKPNLHKRNGIYYLSAGSHYATSSNIYGPYKKIGNTGNNNYGLTPQAHGNFFQWKNQWFHTWCKFHLSKEVARYRESYISYLHYKKNGEMVTDTVLLRNHFNNGVGQYDARWDMIQAEWYMASDKTVKSDHESGFEISEAYNGGYLTYPNVRNLDENATLEIRIKGLNKGVLMIIENTPNGRILGQLSIEPSVSNSYAIKQVKLNNAAGKMNLCFTFSSKHKKNIAAIDEFRFLRKARTNVSIVGEEFHINGVPTYDGRRWQGKKIQGLLMNSRMVQGIFNDLNPENVSEFAYADTKVWDPERNNREFIEAMSEWKAFGLNAFTMNIQGGSPYGYGNKKAYNPGFNPDGSLMPDYMSRLKKIIDRADELNMVVILGLFYFGQDQHLKDEEAVINATRNTINWLHSYGYKNVLIEVTNESYAKIGYEHKILHPQRIHELIELVKNIKKDGYAYPVTTSFIGKGVPTKNVVDVSDYILIHGNGAGKTTQLQLLIDSTKEVMNGKVLPIVINEDDHYDFQDSINNFKVAIDNYVSWGYFDFRRKNEALIEGFQSMPADWGVNSDRKIDFFNMVADITGSPKRKQKAINKSATIVIEAESTKSPLGMWNVVNTASDKFVKGASGDHYLEFQGNDPDQGEPNSPLSYEFIAPEDGDYRVVMMSSKRLEGVRGDMCNDAWVKMDGDFETACKLSTQELKDYIKFFQEGSVKTPELQWKWAYRAEKGKHIFFDLIYKLKKRQKYTFTVAGRSQRFSFDYIQFFDTSKKNISNVIKKN
jgi:arabinoxylan arabinofuranohydrolase